MPKIQLETDIQSTLEICFDLARSIDLHKISTRHTKEEAIAGRTVGLIVLGEFVTWQATHFGIRQQLTSKITAMERPYFLWMNSKKDLSDRFITGMYLKQKTE